MEWNRIVRRGGAVPLALAATLLLPAAAPAQEVNEDYVVSRLGPAAEEMMWSGVDGSGSSAPTIIEISQRWGIEPAYWVSVEEARFLVRVEREDRERARLASLPDATDGYPSRLTLARFGVVPAGALSCAQTKERARLAMRLSQALAQVSQLNGVGTGLVGMISSGAARFVAPLAFATMVTGFASSWAGQLAGAYTWAPCVTGGQPWRSRPNVLGTSLSLDPSRTPPPSRGRPGWRPAVRRTGPTSRPLVPASPSCSPPATGSTPSSSSRSSSREAARA